MVKLPSIESVTLRSGENALRHGAAATPQWVDGPCGSPASTSILHKQVPHLRTRGWRERKEGRERGGRSGRHSLGCHFPRVRMGLGASRHKVPKKPIPPRNALHLNLVREDRKRERKEGGRGRKVHRLTRGSIRLAVVATKYQYLSPLTHQPPNPAAYSHTA